MTYTAAELEVFRRAAFGRCRAAGATVEDAQDCAQDAVAGLLAQSEVRHPKAWVATVAYHRYVDVCRLRDRESAAGLVPAPDTWLPGLPGPEDEVLDRIHARWLVRAMERWPASTRAVCVGVASGRPRLRIISQLGITDRAVESHLTRARRLLRSLSLLGVAVAFAMGRLVRRLTPVGKPAAGVLVPSLAFTLAVGAGALWSGGTADQPPTGTVPTVVGQPPVDGPGGRPAPGGGGPPTADAGRPADAGPTAQEASPDAAVVLGALGSLDRPRLPLVPDLPAVPVPAVPVVPLVPLVPITPPALPVAPAAPPVPAVLPVPPLPSVPPIPPVLPRL